MCGDVRGLREISSPPFVRGPANCLRRGCLAGALNPCACGAEQYTPVVIRILRQLTLRSSPRPPAAPPTPPAAALPKPALKEIVTKKNNTGSARAVSVLFDGCGMVKQ